jgi:hypothetical protein
MEDPSRVNAWLKVEGLPDLPLSLPGGGIVEVTLGEAPDPVVTMQIGISLKPLRIRSVDFGAGVTLDQIEGVDWSEAISQAFAAHVVGTIDRMVEGDPAGDSPQRRAYIRRDELKLDRVAELYRSDPDAPRRAVQEGMGVSRSTAARWIQLARDEGKL